MGGSLSETLYNPLDKRNLGRSVADAMLSRPMHSLPPEEAFIGAGIYAIYYFGSHPAYMRLAELNKQGHEMPIYIGKAIPPGARKGAFGLGEAPGNALFGRLSEHAGSIGQAENLDLTDFRCKYLVVDDIWIPLGEQLLIKTFRPVWNTLIGGFGNHDPGSGRYNQQRSPWDTVHPGRSWASKLKDGAKSAEETIAEAQAFLDQIEVPASQEVSES